MIKIKNKNNNTLTFKISEKRKKLRKEGKDGEPIPEDDAEKYKHAIYVMVMKVCIKCNYK